MEVFLGRQLLHRERMLQLGRSEVAFCELGSNPFRILFAYTFAYFHKCCEVFGIREMARFAGFPFCSRSEAMRGDGACASVARIEAARAAFKLTVVRR